MTDEEIYLLLQFNFFSWYPDLGERHLFAQVMRATAAEREAYHRPGQSKEAQLESWNNYQQKIIQAVRDYRAAVPMTEPEQVAYEQWAFGTVSS